MLSNFSFGHTKSRIKKLFHTTAGQFLLSRTVLHATASSEYKECLQLIPSWKGFVLPNFVKLPPAPVASRSEGAVFQIGFLSRIDQKKGIELLMQAVSRLSFPYQLRIAGAGESSYVLELKQRGEKLGMTSNICWEGWKEGDEKFYFLQSIDLFALTSVNENFGNVVIESLSVGTPVVVSDGVGLSDFVTEKQMGWVAQYEAEDIYFKIMEAHENKVKRAEINHHAPAMMRELFTGSLLANQYLENYKTSTK
jgi:glycosyltransferase involved in cell wall biosynthesis